MCVCVWAAKELDNSKILIIHEFLGGNCSETLFPARTSVTSHLDRECDRGRGEANVSAVIIAGKRFQAFIHPRREFQYERWNLQRSKQTLRALWFFVSRWRPRKAYFQKKPSSPSHTAPWAAMGRISTNRKRRTSDLERDPNAESVGFPPNFGGEDVIGTCSSTRTARGGLMKHTFEIFWHILRIFVCVIKYILRIFERPSAL